MMKLYGVPLSQPTRSVAWTMLQLHVPFQMEMAVPGMTSKMGTQHGNFRNLTPHRSAQIPVVVYPENDGNEIRLSESPAVMTHLCEGFNKAGTTLYPPSNLAVKAKVDSYMHWHHSNTRYLAKIFQTKVRPDLKVQLTDKDHERIQELLQVIDQGWLKYDGNSSGFIGGASHATVADILAYGEFSSVTMTKLLSISEQEYPNIATWLNSMSQLPYHDQVHKSLTDLGDLSIESDTPIAKRLGTATKSGLESIKEAQQQFSSKL